MSKLSFNFIGPGATNRLSNPTNLFNVYTNGAGTIGSNGGGGNNGNRNALKRRASLGKGTMKDPKPRDSSNKCCFPLKVL